MAIYSQMFLGGKTVTTNINNDFSSIFLAPNYQNHDAWLRSNLIANKKLLKEAETLNNKPIGWNMFNRVRITLQMDRLDAEILKLKAFEESEEEEKIVVNYVRQIILNYIDVSESPEYFVRPDTLIIRFIKTGNWEEIRKLMEKTLLLYTLGPFSFASEPDKYISEEHKNYRVALGNFGVNVHLFYGQRNLPGGLLEQNKLITSLFRPIGDELRKIIWQSQNL